MALGFIFLINSSEDLRTKLKGKYSQVFFHLAFMILVTAIVFHKYPSDSYNVKKALKFIFVDRPFIDSSLNWTGKTPEYYNITFNEIASVKDIWGFLLGPFVDALKDPHTPNNMLGNVTVDSKKGKPLVVILSENVVIGIPKMRQVRSKECEVHETFKQLIDKCYGKYEQATEDTLTSPGCPYVTAKESKTRPYGGKITTYGGGGFTCYLTGDGDAIKTALFGFKSGNFITRATRAVFVDIITYNANLNLLSITTFVFEKSASGSVTPSWQALTFSPFHYVTTWDYIIMAMQIIFGLIIISSLLSELIELYMQRLKYLTDFWNLIDLGIISIGLGMMINFIIWQKDLRPLLDNEIGEEDININVDFYNLANRSVIHVNLCGLLFYFIFIKIFKYLNFSQTMVHLSLTLQRSFLDVLAFSVIVVIIFLAFAKTGTLFFGAHIYEFRNVYTSIFTLFRAILGDFNYVPLEEDDNILGPIFFFLFTLVVFFVLLNMFLAILSDAYAKVKSEKDDSYEIKFFANAWNKTKRCSGVSRWCAKKNITWGEALRDLQFGENDIRKILTCFEKNENSEISPCSLKHLARLRADDNFNKVCQTVPADIKNLHQRITKYEVATLQISLKFEDMLSKLDPLLEVWLETSKEKIIPQSLQNQPIYPSLPKCCCE